MTRSISKSSERFGACSHCGDVLIGGDGLCQRCYDKWPKCAVAVCQNKSCLRLNSIYCWPHTPGELAIDDLDLLAEEEGEDTNVENSYAR